ncbi:MAG: acyltransferase [Lachnospiraceae bacterium]|nr:acyltransferase [Lachnospiraceae bacterium]
MNKKRNANIELLRILSMLMVTMLHALGKSELLVPFEFGVSGNAWIAWIFEALSIGAVNIFMLISGYFLIHSEFKWKRLAEIILQVLFYSVGAYLVLYFLGITLYEEKNVYYVLQYVLPIHMDVYWFITAYVVIYALLPVISAGVKALPEKTLRGVILLLLVYECVIKSILPVVLETDSKGYSVLWYLIMFLLGAYFRLYGFHFLNAAWKGVVAYFAGSLLVLAETAAIGEIYRHTNRLGMLTNVGTNYNHIFVVLAAVGIFAAFVQSKPIKEGPSRIICMLSPYALGVYLLQENVTLRYRWQKWFGLDGALDGSLFRCLGILLGSVLAMYVMGTVIDFVRSMIFRGIASLAGKQKM